jgi:hypothetical protein
MVLGFVPCSIAYASPVVRKAFSLSTPRLSEADRLSSEQASGRGMVQKFTVTCWHHLRQTQKK